jgi:hypothetical protein
MKDNWQGFCKHTENIKKEYCKRDTVIPDIKALSYTSILTVEVTDTECGSNDTEDCSVIATTALQRVKTRTCSLHSQYNVSDKCFCTDSSNRPRQKSQPTVPHSLHTFQVSSYQSHTVP